jgi:hypothetical protein
MADLTPEIVGDVTAACRTAADEIVASLSRALDGQFLGVTIGEGTLYDAAQPPKGFDGPGLAIVLKFGDVGIQPATADLVRRARSDRPQPT